MFYLKKYIEKKKKLTINQINLWTCSYGFLQSIFGLFVVFDDVIDGGKFLVNTLFQWSFVD